MAQHDFAISNGSGKAVREDIDSALKALVSNNSGNDEPSPTYAYQFWADTNAGLLKIRNAANNAWITLRELDGTLSIEAGTVSAPGLYFTGDPNTGLYSPAADQLAITTGGVERVEWGTTEVVFNDGGADYDFRVEGNTKPNLFKVDAGTDTVIIDGLTHPSADGTADQALVTNGSGVLSFASRSRLVRTASQTASGASIVFTGIPSWVRRITLMFVGMSAASPGTNHFLVRLGDSGGLETTGYISSSNALHGGTTSASTSSTNGFLLYSTADTNILSGQLILSNYDGNGWVATGMWDYSNTSGITGMTAGYKGLSGTLDRIDIATSDNFDSGTISVIYEG